MTRLLIAVAAAALLAACNQGGDGNQALAEANTSGNEASAAIENAVAHSSATPLEEQQALALMKERHENYEKIGDAMKVVSRELKASSPDLAQVRSNAVIIAELAPQVKGWFPVGTGPDVGKTDARAEIWQNPQDFQAKAGDFEKAAAAFQAAARGNDVGAMQSAHADLGKSCKACHDLYREKE
ncbi:MAG: cytochrome c [Pseudomonadota bacterium]|nr:cytochrome c [Pseudomonadota bacterium]